MILASTAEEKRAQLPQTPAVVTNKCSRVCCAETVRRSREAATLVKAEQSVLMQAESLKEKKNTTLKYINHETKVKIA